TSTRHSPALAGSKSAPSGSMPTGEATTSSVRSAGSSSPASARTSAWPPSTSTAARRTSGFAPMPPVPAAPPPEPPGIDAARPMTTHTTAHYFIEGLHELGLEFVFSNFGTDHAPLIEEFARHEADGTTLLTPILCPHESTA